MSSDLQPSVVPPRSVSPVWKVIAIVSCAFLGLVVLMGVIVVLGAEGY